MAVIEFKNQETEIAFMRSLNPTPQKVLPVKVAYQKFAQGKAVYTLLTCD